MVPHATFKEVLNPKFWHFLGREKKWVAWLKRDISKGRFKISDLTDRATVILADVDSGENYWMGYPIEHYVIVRVRIDSDEVLSYNFRAKYECSIYFDPKKSENLSKAHRIFTKRNITANTRIWLCPDNDGPHAGYIRVGNENPFGSDYYKTLDGTTFRVEITPAFEMNVDQEINAFQFTALNIVKATVSNTSNSNVPSIEFETSTDHGLKDGDRVIVKGCSPEKLNIQSENNISKRGIEVETNQPKKFRVIDPFVAKLMLDNTIAKDIALDQNGAIAYLDTSDFEILAEILAGQIDYNKLIQDIKDKYDDVEVFKREMATVGDSGKLIGWINEQLQILQFPNSSANFYFDIDTYRGIIALKRYFKSINEELYNGLGIGDGCNRDTSNLTGIEKQYCESSEEPCGCYTLGCMIFQEATDNRLETHTIQTTDSEFVDGVEHIKFTTDHPHGLANGDNVIIEKCRLGKFNLTSKEGIVVGGQDPCVFYVKLREYKQEHRLSLTQQIYNPKAKVSLSQQLPSKNWNKLVNLNASEPTTFIEQFSLNTANYSTNGSVLYLPIANLHERIKVRKGWGAALRIYLTDSSRNRLESQWGMYGTNLDYLLGSRDELLFQRKSDNSIFIGYDKRSKTSASLMEDIGSSTFPSSSGFLAIELLTVRSTYGEWMGNGVTLPADFGLTNGVAAVDKFIGALLSKFGLTGLSVKGGIELKLAAVLEIALIFELKFGLIAKASLELKGSGEGTLEADMGFFASAGVDLGNIGMEGTSATVETAKLQRYTCTSMAETRLMFLSLMNPFLGPLAVEFNPSELKKLAKIKDKTVSEDTFSGEITIPQTTVKFTAKHVNTEIKNSSHALAVAEKNWEYSANIGKFDFTMSNKVSKDYEKEIVSTENFYMYNLLGKPPKISDAPDKAWMGFVIAAGLTSGVVMTGFGIGQAIAQITSKSEEELEQQTQNWTDHEKDIYDALKKLQGFATNPKLLAAATMLYGTVSTSSTLLQLEHLKVLRDTAENLRKFSGNLKNLKSLKEKFSALGEIVKTTGKKGGQDLRFEVGVGFLQSYPDTLTLENAEIEAKELEKLLNVDGPMSSKIVDVLQYQQNASLPASRFDLCLLAKIEKTYELKTPRIPLFYGVKFGVEFEFKAYAEGKWNLIESYDSFTMLSQVNLVEGAANSWENETTNQGGGSGW